MKRLWLTILFLALGMFASAQTQLTASQSREVVASLTEATASMQTLQCRFVQQKTMSMLAEPTISEGTLHYAAPDKMRWEYAKPYQFALIVNGAQTIRIKDGKTEKLDANQAKMYKGLADLIMGSASGKKLFDTTIFDVVLFDDGEVWKAEMTPKRRDMKRMFSQLVFRFDKTMQTATQVEFIEPNGDKTLIRFLQIELNVVIDDGTFKE